MLLGNILDVMSANPPKEIQALIKLVNLVSQGDPYCELVNRTLGKQPNYEQRKKLLETGAFSKQDYMNLLHVCGDGLGTALWVIMPLFNRLLEWGIVVEYPFSDPRALVNYYWDKERVTLFVSLGIVDNVILGSSYVARKYHESVPAIYVRKQGDECTGTGFLAASPNNIRKRVIITAKHNIDPKEDIEFIGLSKVGEKALKPVNDTWILHPNLDLALLEVDCDNSIVPIFPLGNPSVLMRTISLGYPRIATTDASYLLVHGGELNAIVNTYHGEDRLIISNVVAPGNSGGPVLDEAGLCAGVVVNSFETQHQGGIEKSNSAIPAKHVLDFINNYFCELSI